MSELEVKKIIKNYVKKLRAENYPISAAYLFGSYAKGKANKWSDIDTAIISPKFKNRFGKSYMRLWDFREEIDNRIEPHGFTATDFKNLADPLVYEIRKTGIKVV
ncbi:MAG: polymerase, beta-like protein region protein [Parcubacteria group bacterium GW2011_GWF2_38_8]|nr:MAG: polymerase, beta-like protein region protein [Parcubacteria group bacterium GW2011_GWF2_38_8]